MQEWLDFYLCDDIVDQKHKTQFSAILGYTMSQMDEDHYFIQWLFPNRRPSSINELAPVLTDGMIEEFQDNDALRKQVFVAIDLFLNFLGIERSGHKIGRADNFHINCRYWLRCTEHNHLRISRLLHFLVEIKQYSLAKEVLSFLVGEMEIAGIAEHCDFTIGYWRDVLKASK